MDSNASKANNLTIEGLDAAYGAVRVIEGVSLNVRSGETVALLGTNGNGKSTLMKCVMGIVPPRAGRIVAEIDGVAHDLVGRSTEEIVDLGVALVPEGRRLFPRLTVEENLLLGAFRGKARAEINANREFCFECFPRLAERRAQLAGSMSGGEQQMLAIARGLMAEPRLIILDEPSLGLMPIVTQEVFKLIETVNRSGIGVLLVEQNLHQALRIAHRGYVLEKGSVVLAGTGQELLANDYVRKAFLGH